MRFHRMFKPLPDGGQVAQMYQGLVEPRMLVLPGHHYDVLYILMALDQEYNMILHIAHAQQPIQNLHPACEVGWQPSDAKRAPRPVSSAKRRIVVFTRPPASYRTLRPVLLESVASRHSYAVAATIFTLLSFCQRTLAAITRRAPTPIRSHRSPKPKPRLACRQKHGCRCATEL
jgi:hypothetical protein